MGWVAVTASTACRADDSAAALAGLGRSLAALGRHDEACRAYKQIGAAAAALRTEASTFLASCR